ncbi:MAG: EAL domain-containing protein [Actinomycetota bacterium]|nr:EAL domain-containing protein [Actinomycetota bacterium]
MPSRFLAAHVHAVLSDPERLRVLRSTGLMDSDQEERLDRWAEVAAEALNAPVALISLVDDRREFVKSVFGSATEGRELPLILSFCQYVVADRQPLAVDDVRGHDALRDSAAVHDLEVVAYVGAPIVVSGQPIGALCVGEPDPRAWSPAELRLLNNLAQGLGYEVELRVAAGELARSNELIAAHNRIHELIAKDHPLPRILDAIVTSIETHDPDLGGSVLLLDPRTQTLHHGAAGRLPTAYLQAIDGLAIGPGAGSCGAAAFSGQEEIGHDLRSDERWTDHRHLVEPLGLRHCWAFPVVRGDGRVLGTLAVYGKRPRSPSDDDRRFLRDAAGLAGIAVERRRSQDRLVHDATHDPLTGLADRAAAFARFDDLLARDAGLEGPFAVLFVDLDRLKTINDSLGHDAGDEVIRQAAQRLSGCTGPDDLVARLGGEEFLVLSVGGHDQAAELAERALLELRAPLAGLSGGQDLSITASIGIVVLTDASIDARGALRRADAAMYAAKARGGNAYAWSDDGDPATPSRRPLIQAALRHAIERRELSLVYQPLQSFADDRPFAVEALLRWTHSDLGTIPPDEFVPIAEQTGVIGPIGSWVLRSACADLPALVAQHGDDIHLAVNVSARQLSDPGLPGLFTRTLAEHGLAADRLFVEITETALIGSDPTTTETVRALDAMGARVALDDFGTGYSSLAMLNRHPISLIKIDRSFIDGLPEDHGSLAIVTALIGMGSALGLAIVAEGIETQRQYDTLHDLGCDYAQGYLLGRPAVVSEPPAGLGRGAANGG